MIVRMISIDVEGLGELAVALLALTFVVTFQRLALRSFRIDTRGEAFDLLLAPLTFASEESF